MNKLKMLVLTALAAATVGTGALAAAPSASAMPARRDCKALLFRATMYLSLEQAAIGVGDYSLARYYGFWVTIYQDAAEQCILG